MPRFSILPLESANRVYGAQAGPMLAAELRALASVLDSTVTVVRTDALGGVEYVTFETPGLDDHDLVVVSNLSGTRALFEVVDELFRPVELAPVAYFDHDLVTIQRYPGKTNEQFTHLLVNLASAASDAAAERSAAGKPVRLLDPVAGRGTTLNRALVAGYDTTGIEVVEGDVDHYRTFITTYLKGHRIKHTTSREQVRKGPLAGTARFGVTIRGGQRVEIVRADTTTAAELFPARSFDILVADLPYGVQHRASSATSRRRSPTDLLAESLPGWRQLLRNGASLALAWNVKTLAGDEVRRLLAEHDLDVVDHPASFEHVVDRAITRDVVVAVKRRG